MSTLVRTMMMVRMMAMTKKMMTRMRLYSLQRASSKQSVFTHPRSGFGEVRPDMENMGWGDTYT